MNLTLSCLVIFLAFAMTCLTGPAEGRPHSLHEHGRPRSSSSYSGSGSDSSDDEKTSDEFDLCAANPCKNNGTCSNTGIDYECACPIYYVGKNCEEFDPCAATPCKNNGTCNETGNDYQCECTENYVGKNCEGSCQPGWVLNDGKCYYFSQDERQWEAARDACVNLSMSNGHLVEVNDIDEQLYLNSQVKTEMDIRWLGLNDRDTEGPVK